MYRLETERLLLTRVSEDHEAEIHRLHRDPLIVGALFDGKQLSVAENRERLALYLEDWRRHGFGFFIVQERRPGGGGGQVIGRSGFRYLGQARPVEFGHCFTAKASGRGIASEAGRAVIRFGMTVLGISQLVGFVRQENHRGLSTLLKLGFRHVDDRPHHGRKMKYFALTSEEVLRREASNKVEGSRLNQLEKA